MEPIVRFDGPNRWLSNFWPCHVWLEDELGEFEADSVEHAYQAAKTLDSDKRIEILLTETPGKAKRMGGKVKLRPDWSEVRLPLMERLQRQKYRRGEMLEQKLFETGEVEIIEGNTWGDVTFGCVLRDGVWVGENHMGKILMKIRSEIRLGP